MGIKISPHKRGAVWLPNLRNGRGRSVPRKSSFMVRYRASRCLSASLLVALPAFAGSPGEAMKRAPRR